MKTRLDCSAAKREKEPVPEGKQSPSESKVKLQVKETILRKSFAQTVGRERGSGSL